MNEKVRFYVPEESRMIPAKYIGYAEGMFFTLAVAFQFSGVLIAMMLWVAAKLTVNWRWRAPRSQLNQFKALRSLIMSLTSLGFALVGGLIARWGLSLV